MTREASSLVENKIIQVGNYKFTGKVLGKGSFAVVNEAIHIELKVYVSVKTIDLNKSNSYTLKNISREAIILRNLDHPYIMRLFEIIKHHNFYYMVTEVVRGIDLCSYVQQKRGKLEENTTRKFSRQIGSALKYLHKRGVVHRDLKLENIMLDSSTGSIKLIDFGLSNSWTVDSPLKTLCGSPEYCAPELFTPGTVYGTEVDLWALGVIMYAMAAGRLPFPCVSSIMKEPDKKSQFLKTINGGLSDAQTKLIKGYNPQFILLIKGLMNPNWEERLSIDDVFRDVWMTNTDHWVNVPHESLDPHDLQLIFRKLCDKLKIHPEKLKSELVTQPCGEAGGFYNILKYREIFERRQRSLDITSTIYKSETTRSKFNEISSPKIHFFKQISNRPNKISLLGNAIKLNGDACFTPVRGTVTNSSGLSTSVSKQAKPSDKGDFCERKKKEREWVSLPKIRSLKSCNHSDSSLSTTKSNSTTANEFAQINTKPSNKRKCSRIVILPSKIKVKPSAKRNFDQEHTFYQRNLT